ncbi:MAG: transketolase C-terminal domain-containing protein [Christensenellaceae bacterium]|nr:transketolase C-terminal domain-containing protein [Eubacteriales bacterium]MEA5069437.1 transketolase C-terminal domain-containing protein [Christensenellaceae bacterium]
MSVILSKTHETEKVTIASAYASALLAAMRENPMIVDLEADLGRSLLGGLYVEMRDSLPKQFVDCGIQEANMMSVAAGLSAMGRTAFIHTFASFAARRIADQVFISGCYSGANVRIIGSDPGITAQFNGGTHMPFEDISVYRAFPGMTILDPCDSVMTANLTSQLTKTKGMYYIRMFRKNAVKIYEEGSDFVIGKANVLRAGNDVTLIASGAVMVAEALKAAELLQASGVSARVLDMFTIKPLDAEAVLCAARETGAIVTAENHNVINGLGSAVADVLATKGYAPLEKIGVQDQFGEVGPLDYLKERFALRAEDIAQAALRAIARK